MKKDKTKTYSGSNKTSTYGDAEKLTKETVHNIKAGDNIILNNKEYKILEIISESTGEAVIYKIENKKKNILVLKLYYEFHDPENEPNTEALSRIKNIEDVDILNLIDYGTGINKYKGKYCFEISDFAYGHDLMFIDNFKEKYSPDFIIKEVISQIFLGIQRLHENKIYHCDLKPQNIFFLDKEQTEIVIGDYGSAKTFEFDAEKQSRKTTTVKGTDFYLPPEQARGFISEKNDYYSFGMILLHLFYPEEILLNVNEPKSLSHLKLKQIIERQFESKPIIDFNPKFKRINSLIEGLTLEDFNLRWGKEQVKKWIKGEQINVIYKNSAQYPSNAEIKALIFGEYTINTVYDIRDYILNDPDWYVDLIEDKDNRADFTEWFLKLYGGNKSKRSEFNRIVKNYSQDGVDFVAEAIIRFFIPEHPVILGVKTFDFYNSPDLKKTVALTFSHLIHDLWKSSSDNDIKLYFFRFEFALWQLKNQQQEVLDLLTILYRELNIKKKIKTDSFDFKVYAYTSGSKESLNKIKKFLCKYLPSKSNINFIRLNEQNGLDYKIELTLAHFFTEIGIENSIIEDIITIDYPDNYNSKDEFFKKVFDTTISSICNNHFIKIKLISDNSLEQFKNDFKNEYNKLFENLKQEFHKLKQETSRKIKRQNPVKSNLKEIESIISKNKFHKINDAFYFIYEIRRYSKKQIEIQKNRIHEDRVKKRNRRRNIFIAILPIIAVVVLWTFLLRDKWLPNIQSVVNYENITHKYIASNKIEMVFVKGGTFMMGHKGGPKNERPLHKVSLNDFYISKYEITNEQFCWFLNIYGSDIVKSGEHTGEKMIYYSDIEGRDWGVNYTEEGWRPNGGYEHYPVVYVTWYGANEFCMWANGRLPTEAEWEYAAKGGDKSEGYRFPGSNKVYDVAWCYDNSDIETHKVGKKDPNELEIFDMSGNVFEWCEDWYHAEYYIVSPESNPLNFGKTESKVLRGGSYYTYKKDCMPCYRIGEFPDKYFSNFGFRLCKYKFIDE
ncbi:MAG: SUMF1/EgtB/PvdO family nonheme iron enzyme [Bacteroidales bacterium]|nr:SUMF1/EgtB/PvdO family nonheme iron enzyme [Bacteroidales bacterium]